MCDAPIVDPTYVWLVNVWLVMRELEKKGGGKGGFVFFFVLFFHLILNFSLRVASRESKSAHSAAFSALLTRVNAMDRLASVNSSESVRLWCLQQMAYSIDSVATMAQRGGTAGKMHESAGVMCDGAGSAGNRSCLR